MRRTAFVVLAAVAGLIAISASVWLVIRQRKAEPARATVERADLALPLRPEHDSVLADALGETPAESTASTVEAVLKSYRSGTAYPPLSIDYPFDESVFPPDIVSPTFEWSDGQAGVDRWLIVVAFQDSSKRFFALTGRSAWAPAKPTWEAIKSLSLEKQARVTIFGLASERPGEIRSCRTVRLATSKDPVEAPIFYRELPLPFEDVLKHMEEIRWRMGTISSEDRPPAVLENLPVCGNCHSFSRDGRMFGMDVDYANDKGGYAIVPVAREMVLSKDRVISWTDFRKDDGELTFGLLSQVSPDGRYVVSTVKDVSLFVPMPDLNFSQLFYPVKGILAVYSVETGKLWALSGADDRRYVQSNPSWSPDGKYIVFARAPLQQAVLDRIGLVKSPVLMSRNPTEFRDERYHIQYDLYRIPFNEGRGGKPEPLKGASRNGKGNFFARYSPDGRWIVFTQSKNAMLLQPDSRLYIMPAEGGRPRKMRCNMARMNSWHSWSPNGRWLVFSSKARTPYTQLFLTHIDENGNDTPPVLLAQFTSPERAANIPEFVNIPPGGIARITQRFVDDYSFARMGVHEFELYGELDRAEELFKAALKINPGNLETRAQLALVHIEKGQYSEAEAEVKALLEARPDDARCHHVLGRIYALRKDYVKAEEELRTALKLDPAVAQFYVDLASVLSMYGTAAAREESLALLAKALAAEPRNAQARAASGALYLKMDHPYAAIEQLSIALRLDPNQAAVRSKLGVAYYMAKQEDKAEREFRAALALDPTEPGANFNLALLLSRRPDGVEQAIQCLNSGLTAAPSDVRMRALLGDLYAKTGQRDLAREAYLKALQCSPDDPSIADKLSELP